jgi:hypothetical protein
VSGLFFRQSVIPPKQRVGMRVEACMTDRNKLWEVVCPERTLLIALAGGATLLVSSVAQAEEAGDYEYQFEAEFLDGKLLHGDGPRIVARPRPARTLLIRPRTSFTRELLKSIEHL